MAAIGSSMSVPPWAICVALLRRCSKQSFSGEAPFSVAVWVGIIALAGVAAETGVVMLVYLDEAAERGMGEGRLATAQDLREAIVEGAVQRVRPKMMTVAAIMGGVLPLMGTTGPGANRMQRLAAPMIGGMISSTVLTLLVMPVLYALWRGGSLLAPKE